jgi:hypothetical protein
VPADRPEESDVLVESRAEAREIPSCGVSAETRDRLTYEAELRAAVAADRWQSVVTRFNERWAEHENRWKREAVDGEGNVPDQRDTRRVLSRDEIAEVDHSYDRIRDAEQRVVTPTMFEIAAEDPSRELAGLNHRLKGPDRLKEKVAQQLESRPGVSAGQALSAVPDAVRYTFRYEVADYTLGVRSDIDRLFDRGYELVKPLKNTWDDENYRGINSQWREPSTGVRFEVQFHTQVSLEAKQVTHCAYERIRDTRTSATERAELVDLQREVNRNVPIPPGADEIKVNPRKGLNA